MKNKIIYVTIAIMLTSVLSRAAEPTCSVEIVEEQYHITVKSDDIRTPIAISTVDVPERTPIVHDSYYNSCIVYGDEDGKTTHRPVQNTLVTIWGYPNSEWSIDTNTSFTGCFDAMLPADSNFTIKAIDPRTKEFVKLDGFMMSGKEGQLLSNDKHGFMHFPSKFKYEAEPGIIAHTIKGDTLTIKGDLDIEKHSMIVSIPTVAGQEYVVSLAINKPLWVWFGDGTREGSNPAKLVGDKGLDHVVNLNPFTAKDEETNLYLQVQNAETITVKDITVK